MQKEKKSKKKTALCKAVIAVLADAMCSCLRGYGTNRKKSVCLLNDTINNMILH